MAEKFEGQFECLRGKTEKYITFLVPIKKDLENDKTVAYKINIIDSLRFVSSSLSSLDDNLTEGIHSNNCTDCKSSVEYIKIEDTHSIFKCLKCNNKHKIHFNKDVIKLFANTYECCDGDINKFCLMLRKGIYPYKYMDSWKRFRETSSGKWIDLVNSFIRSKEIQKIFTMRLF